MDLKAHRDSELADLRLGHFPGMSTKGNVNLVRPLGVFMQELKQPLGVDRTAGPGDRHNEFHYQ